MEETRARNLISIASPSEEVAVRSTVPTSTPTSFPVSCPGSCLIRLTSLLETRTQYLVSKIYQILLGGRDQQHHACSLCKQFSLVAQTV